VLMSSDLGGGVPLPLTLIYRGLPPIKLLLFKAFLESLDFVTLFGIRAPYRRKTNRNPFFALLDNL
jgi:hypothetical protein